MAARSPVGRRGCAYVGPCHLGTETRRSKKSSAQLRGFFVEQRAHLSSRQHSYQDVHDGPDARLASLKPRMSLDCKHCRRETNRGARNGMAKSAANITFEPKPLNNGPQWLVVVTFPHAQQEQVEGFPTVRRQELDYQRLRSVAHKTRLPRDLASQRRRLRLVRDFPRGGPGRANDWARPVVAAHHHEQSKRTRGTLLLGSALIPVAAIRRAQCLSPLR